MSKLTIIIVTWNSMRYILNCLESLLRQTFRDFSVIIVDNGSDDGTVEFIRTHYPAVFILQNFKNLGYAKANNQGIKMAKSEYVLIINHDVVLAENFLETLINFAQTHLQGGSFGGKLLKLYTQDIDPAENGSGLKELVKSNIIDSTGLKIFKSRKVINRGENEKDQGQYQRAEEVFGISGACVLFRKSALEEIFIRNEYFDQNFFAYKEDIDLAWRLRLYGWQAWYLPEAIVYHHRQLSFPPNKNLKERIESRKKISKFLRALSFKNHYLTLIKDEQPINLLIHLPPFLWQEFKIFIYSLIFEPFLWKTIVIFFKQLPETLLKRKIIMAHCKVNAKEMRKWFK